MTASQTPNFVAIQRCSQENHSLHTQMYAASRFFVRALSCLEF